MQAFHGNSQVKRKYLARVRRHRAADEIIKGQYWYQGKGCAVGCTIHGDDHKKYETQLGIPEALAEVEDNIFETIPSRDAKDWPITFLSSIRTGADLSGVMPKLILWVLTQAPQNAIRTAPPEARDAVRDVAALYAAQTMGLQISEDMADELQERMRSFDSYYDEEGNRRSEPERRAVVVAKDAVAALLSAIGWEQAEPITGYVGFNPTRGKHIAAKLIELLKAAK